MPTGPEKLVLQAVHDLPKDQYGNVHDAQIVSDTGLSLPEVTACLVSLDQGELVSKIRLEDGHLAAHITAKGSLKLSQEVAIPNGPNRRPPGQNLVKIVPKGLRSFDAEDKDFFLELLPGPRRGDGLPESVHFWKVRIEEMDPDKTFRVGYIFGPSGCGKSSLIKAGLLPRLPKSIIPIYVEATGEETEARLVRGLRKHNPDLPSDLDLHTALVTSRERTREGSNKLLLVIDQFEQWYHAKGTESGTELAYALSECDGGRVQAIILVRDDFSMALHRFMAAIGVRQNQDQNFAVVDLFDLQHARKVLIAFGWGYGKLPDDPKEMTGPQNEFLDRTIKGLSQEGRVVSVRLALFAEMLKGKPWTPETLKQVGGAEGVGVTFLEETFSARTAPPSYRIHEKAAQAVLKKLLPETGANIKGNMRSYDELLAVSGYGSRPSEFDELIRILNSELRLISPTEPEGSEGECQTKTQVSERYFLLTHDYLVPSIRQWLTRKQKETRRGRAELKLAERSATWNARPENRQLPSVLEWINIRFLTEKKDWTEPQRKMMKRAGQVHGLRALGLVVLISLVTWGGIEGYGNLRAESLVESLKTASTTEVPAIIKQLTAYHRWAARPLDRSLASTEKQGGPHLRASLVSLALRPGDRKQAEYLEDRLLVASPVDLPVIWGILREQDRGVDERLRQVLEDPKSDPERRFRAACALANSDAANGKDRWSNVAPFITDRFLTAVIKNPSDYSLLIETLRPIRHKLLSPLAAIFRDTGRSESERSFTTTILSNYASDDSALLADLLMDAEPNAYETLFPVVERHRLKSIPLLQAEIEKRANIPAGEANPEQIKDRLAERQARAAIALVRMGKADEVWTLLRHSADPRLRSYIVNWLSPLGADTKSVVAGLDGIDAKIVPLPTEGQQKMDAILFHPETSMRRALILALGTYGSEGLSPDEREDLSKRLLDLYRNDPDAGIHGAAEWTLRQWNQKDQLKVADAELMKRKEWGDCRWFVNSQGQTFAVIDGPVEFLMGSPPTEPDHVSNETVHRVRIPRRFAIATKEVSREQWQNFVKQNPDWDVDAQQVKQYSPDLDGPMLGFSWYIAAAYCNWLSKQEGLADDQWCYLPTQDGAYRAGMTVPANVLDRKGYRMPTEAEWEYACRSGTGTSRPYGQTTGLLEKYARYQANSQEHAWPSGSLLPNDLGLFDMLGNVNEWCQDKYEPYRSESIHIENDNIIKSEIINENPRLLRGGSFTDHPAFVRSAYRVMYAPSFRIISVGLRPSRTYP